MVYQMVSRWPFEAFNLGQLKLSRNARELKGIEENGELKGMEN
jgi:hypothetical protein